MRAVRTTKPNELPTDTALLCISEEERGSITVFCMQAKFEVLQLSITVRVRVQLT